MIAILGVLPLHPIGPDSCNKNTSFHTQEDDDDVELDGLSEKEFAEHGQILEKKIYELEFGSEPNRKNMHTFPKYKFPGMINNAAGDEGRLD